MVVMYKGLLTFTFLHFCVFLLFTWSLLYLRALHKNSRICGISIL
nr:MAG TPA: hypothetical protein [Caudoviricetes sp.]